MDKPKLINKYEEIKPFQATAVTMDNLFNTDPNATLLYAFYVNTYEWQNINSVYAIDDYCMKWLRWGKPKFRKAKKILTDGGFIESVIRKDDATGKVIGHYIFIHYLVNKPQDLKPQDLKPQDLFTTSGKKTTDTIDNNINTVDEQKDTINKHLNTSYTHISEIFEHWNNRDIIKHQELTDTIKKKITRTLELITSEELKKSIDAYSDILKSQEYFFDHKWSLSDFLGRGISKIGLEERKGFWMFTDENKPYQTFKRYKSEDKFTTIKAKFKPITTKYIPQKLLINNTYYGFEIDMINNTERLHDVKERIRKSKHTYSTFWELEVVIAGLIFRRKHEDNLELTEILVDQWLSLKPNYEEIAARNREEI